MGLEGEQGPIGEQGIQGEQGDPGIHGQDGTNGVCAMAKSCGIASCRKLIVDELKLTFPEYAIIRKKLAKNESLNPKEKKQNRQINTYIDVLIPRCEIYEGDVDEFREIIKNTIDK